MVRTRDGGARKAVAAKAPRKVLASSAGGGGAGGMGSPSGKVSKYAGGNGYCPRPTPDWQKGIAAFVVKKAATDKENSEPKDMETVATPASAAAAAAASAAQGSSSSSSSSSSAAAVDSQSSSSPSSSQETATSSSQPESSPLKKNGLICDSDDD